MASLKKRAIDVYNWFEQRLGLGTPAIEAAEHEVPSNTSSWWYVFGSAATVILVLQVMTGILLALVYLPAPATPGAVSNSSITTSGSAGFCAPCTAGAPTS
jgi:quinol-cytochrome oxidoreductase complex cytochrome b subunit